MRSTLYPDFFYSRGLSTPLVDKDFVPLSPAEEKVYAKRLQEFFSPRVRNCLGPISEKPLDPYDKYPRWLERMFFVN